MLPARATYALLFLATISLGLASRHQPSPLPWWLAKNAGDILYATMCYWLAGVCRPKVSGRVKSGAALLFCFLIELCKLIQAPWLVALRRSRPGRLVLGSGFHWSNLLCYAIGSVLGLALEEAALRLFRGRSPRAVPRA